MLSVQNGSKVKVNYVGKFENGEIFDSSEGKPPLEFVIGTNTVIPGFEEALIGKTKGEKVSVTIKPEEAYGNYDEKLLFEVPKSALPQDYEAKIGDTLQVPTENGQFFPVIINEIKEESIVLDANHPLAGKTLIFDIEIVDVE